MTVRVEPAAVQRFPIKRLLIVQMPVENAVSDRPPGIQNLIPKFTIINSHCKGLAIAKICIRMLRRTIVHEVECVAEPVRNLQGNYLLWCGTRHIGDIVGFETSVVGMT